MTPFALLCARCGEQAATPLPLTNPWSCRDCGNMTTIIVRDSDGEEED